VQSEPAVSQPEDPIATQFYTPTYVAQVPEARGVADPDSFRGTGITLYTNGAHGSSRNGATAAHTNRLRNGDMSRGPLFWTTVGATLGVAEAVGSTNYVIGRRSIQLTSSNVSDDHVYQEFSIDAGVRSITVMVRYRVVLPAATAAFRLDLATWNGAAATLLGFYSDTDNVSTGWRVRSLTARFEGTLTGVQGPRTFRVRLYPFNVDGLGTPGRVVVVDSVWLVDGEYAAPYRPYQEGVELLSGSDRVVLFNGVDATASAGPTGIPTSIRVPSNAVGMVTEMSISGSQASGTTTTLTVNDQLGTDPVRVVHAMVSNRPTLIEYTVPLIPATDMVLGGSNVLWSMAGASGTNLVTYSVRLKAWVYRL
jgi:hypothetical protein